MSVCLSLFSYGPELSQPTALAGYWTLEYGRTWTSRRQEAAHRTPSWEFSLPASLSVTEFLCWARHLLKILIPTEDGAAANESWLDEASVDPAAVNKSEVLELPEAPTESNMAVSAGKDPASVTIKEHSWLLINTRSEILRFQERRLLPCLLKCKLN